MNKISANLKKLLLPSLGILFLYCTFLFICNLNLLDNASRKIHAPHIFEIVLLIITSGFGIEIGLRLIHKATPERWFLRFALGFAVYMFALQVFLTIMPNVSSCHCISFKESIMNILDWSEVEYSGILLVWSIVVINVLRQKHDSN